jgi:hypothetical protein
VEGCKQRHFGHGIPQKKIGPLSQVEGKEGQFTFFKNCPYDPKKINDKYQYGYQKTQNFMLISNALKWT